MSNLKNIKDFDSYLEEEKKWKYIYNSDQGIIVKDIDGEKHQISDNEDIDDIHQVARRVINDDIKKFCGGITEFEMKYGNDKIIHQLYINETEKEKPKKFDDLIDAENKTYGYVSLNDLNLKEEPSIDLFYLHPGSIGNGEVLLPCLFPDVRLSRRTFREEQTKDCESDNYDIEVKSRGSEFKFEENKGTKDIAKQYKTVDKIKELVYEPLADYIIHRYNNPPKDKPRPLIFICYDNEKGKVPTGFFWLKYSGEGISTLIETLQSVIDFKDESGEHSYKFSIVAEGEKLISYCSLFNQNKLNDILKK